MGKGKPRHNPDKPQNKIGYWCQLYHETKDGGHCPHYHLGDAKVCNGNPHMCIKNWYRGLARLSDKQKERKSMPVAFKYEADKRERWNKENVNM